MKQQRKHQSSPYGRAVFRLIAFLSLICGTLCVGVENEIMFIIIGMIFITGSYIILVWVENSYE